MGALAALILTVLPGVIPLAVAPGETLHVTVSGSGRAVLLVPGLLGSAYGYRKVISLLNAAGYQTVVVEPLGVGRSSRPEGADYSLTAQADRIAMVLDRLELAPATIVAHGIGASAALRLAYRHPGAVRAVLSLDGGPAEGSAAPGLRLALKLAPLVEALGGDGIIRKKVRDQMIKASGDESWVTEEVIDGYLDRVGANSDETFRAYRAMAGAKEPEPLGPHLKKIACPVEVLTGGAPHDNAIPTSDIAVLITMVPSIEIYAVPGAGHYIHEEQPQAVVVAVQRLERRAARSARPADSIESFSH
jgi:pimeloyl-ACP methyl ester carboxylesterase